MPTDTSTAALSAALNAPVEEKDDFSDAFANFVKPENEQTPPAKPEPTVAEAEAGAEGKDAPEGTEIEGAPEAEGGEGGEDAPEPTKPEPAAKTATDDALARLADMISQRQPAQPAATTTQAEPPPLYSNEQLAKLQTFYKEWPEVAEATETLLRGAMLNVTNSIYAEMAKVLGPKLKLIEQIADHVQYEQVRQGVPDLNDALVEQVTAWVGTQPAYLRDAYTNVMQKGTASDFTDLVQRFRQETGTAAPAEIAPQGGKAPPAPAKADTLSPAAKKAAAALAPVNSKRTGNTQVEPQGFDDAFEFHAKAVTANT